MDGCNGRPPLVFTSISSCSAWSFVFFLSWPPSVLGSVGIMGKEGKDRGPREEGEEDTVKQVSKRARDREAERQRGPGTRNQKRVSLVCASDEVIMDDKKERQRAGAKGDESMRLAWWVRCQRLVTQIGFAR